MQKPEAYKFTSADAENYDLYLGPLLFEPYALFLASRMKGGRPEKVLELACGSGRVTRHLRAVLPPASVLHATDISNDMIAIAKRNVGEEGIRYGTEDIQNLSFADSSFDVVVCEFGMMFLPDKQKGFSEIARVLKPGGRLLCFTWNCLEKNPLFSLLINELVLPHFPGEDHSRFIAPFSLFDENQMKGWLQTAGFQTVHTETVDLAGQAGLEHVVDGLFVKHPLANAMLAKGEEAMADVARRFRNGVIARFGDNPIFPMSALLTTATK